MRLLGVLFVLGVAACSDPKFTVEELQDPATCMECHGKHYQQWSGSMHAYASEDPVFVAMNKRGQRETNGALGDFCIKCHAPMAVALGQATGADFDPAALTPATKGITCYFCHNVDEVTQDHNNGLVLAMDQTMRGGVQNPSESRAHDSSYDTRMAGRKNNSEMCGSCHDVVTPAGVHIERSFAEWKETIFAQPNPTPESFQHQTCASCHMFPSTEAIAEGGGNRQFGFHEHTLGAIDQALTPFPEMDEQARVVKRDLDAALTIVGLRPRGSQEPYGGICVEPTGDLTVRLDTINVGHMFPSGASQDRRTWVEVKAYDAGGNVIFSSGVVPDGEDPDDGDKYVKCTDGGEACSGFWDRTFKADGTPAHFFWEVATVDSKLLKPQTILDPNATGYDHSTTVKYALGPLAQQIDRVEARLRVRALPLHVLDDLVMSGDLDSSISAQLKTLDSRGAMSVWTKATASTGLAMDTGVPGQSGCNPF
jgi:nitrate/TMAO reductase-like tetraheme cytochrome c subunit